MAENSAEQAQAQAQATQHTNGVANGVENGVAPPSTDGTATKRKADELSGPETAVDGRDDKRRKGTAPIKAEFLVVDTSNTNNSSLVEPRAARDEADDDAAEAFHHNSRQPTSNNSKRSKRQEKGRGQNKARDYGSSRDEVGLCSTRVHAPEFSPEPCPYGDNCRFDHDLRTYLAQHKRSDLTTFNNGLCPVWEVKGRCSAGWKCRFVGSHSKEIEHEDGRRELVLVEDPERIAKHSQTSGEGEEAGVANVLTAQQRTDLMKRKMPTPKSDVVLPWIDKQTKKPSEQGGRRRQNGDNNQSGSGTGLRNSSSPEPEGGSTEQGTEINLSDSRAAFQDPPLRPSEKRRLYFGPETPILAPLTTQGNLPFRRLCTSLGTQFTYSEMAMSLPLLQGHKPEWALMKAHESEVQPPTFTMRSAGQNSSNNIVYDYGYDQSQDLRFGAQIAANKPWVAIKATEVLTTLLPKGLRVVDLNVGCPIDLVYREGAGSALMDAPSKLEKMLRGMNLVSGETPVTVKIRMGTKDKQPTAHKLVERLVLGNRRDDNNQPIESSDPCGVAAITLHGRSRQQRYTRRADWEYISQTAALIKNLQQKADTITDTIHEPDDRDLPNGHKGSKSGKVWFVGNGDVYSHEHYYDHLEHAGVDGVMAARGALIKPWLFEEIKAGQYLDKSSSERLRLVEQFCRYGLEAWGSDEMGVGTTRRFLLEWLSFACRYVPVGLLEYLPPNIQDRPPRYKGRDELETLMASDNYKDWIKISEMFLGPAHPNFRFEPKHKSNSYDTQAEG
ncbi:tRNA-dihydrouridine synthase 3 [Exophiala dermatitidis]|uniref:tRNA-dihydrouridine(47) synthase [NAD(P)(+)] n=1 Tax=Exophiala dermatitidis TaxID=5970 RepID=A0AAN6EZ27_EXODE|nr:tRNA-dihydrouridine synthase 3 [Exophiala dermatitidis]KAJ4524391.1 tRNA-dihydrouridine synthase 3 [Exophiala dermatitidis]KAJ4555748.1 tRNA-dihydrouridine synthase 3 [Exophiala dermatitidis]KAJ4556123.1 tRNA-dihydrouridine synthase 3 [Exophiala dermatitidis]KAJ4569049.1 tRNA-dihydrouridine synthase 3 [Exophiala dermatitidis]